MALNLPETARDERRDQDSFQLGLEVHSGRAHVTDVITYVKEEDTRHDYVSLPVLENLP